MSHRWLSYKGRFILYIDYSECQNDEEMLNQLRETADIFQRAEGGFLTIDDFTGSALSIDFLDEAKAYSSIFNEKRSRAAVLGATGLTRVLVDAYNHSTQSPLIPFRSEADALEYLVEG